MWFTEKKEILEYLGKNGKDTRWLDRAIQRGVVYHDGDTGAYILCTEYIEELEQEVKNLEIQLRGMEILKQEAGKNALQQVDKNDNHLSDSDLIDHIRYLYIRNEMRKDCIEKLVGLYYNKNTAAGWEAAVEKTYQLIGFEEDPEEAAELEYIRSLL